MTPTPEERACAVLKTIGDAIVELPHLVKRDIIATAIADAVAQATERAAKIAETMPTEWDFAEYSKTVTFADIAAAIRDVTAPPTKGT